MEDNQAAITRLGAVYAIQKIKSLGAEKDAVYTERNKLIAALSKVFPSWLETHPAEDKEWAEHYRTIVFIDAPTGQMCWHINDSEVELFSHLEMSGANGSWDGHTTEEKYERLARLPVRIE